MGNKYRYSGPNIFFLILQNISGLKCRLYGDLLSSPGKANQQGSFNYAVMTPIGAEYFTWHVDRSISYRITTNIFQFFLCRAFI